MKPKKNRKSLVGWMFKDWSGEFKFIKNGYSENICHTPWLSKSNNSIVNNQVKVRITITELTQ